MRRLFAAATLCLLAIASGAAAKPRVVSINMCTDQLVLALADREQILGLSHLAGDPALSWHWQQAGGLPALAGQAEEVLPLKPDLVLTATLARSQTRALLTRQGQRVETFASALTIAEVKAQIAQAGQLLAQEARAAAANARIDAALASLKSAGRGNATLRILPLERRGWVSGRDSLIADVLAEAGLTNLGAEASVGGALISLERLVSLKPDALLLSSGNAGAEDQGGALLHHPALRAMAPPRFRLIIPQAMTVCAGPMLAEALDRLADELGRFPAR